MVNEALASREAYLGVTMLVEETAMWLRVPLLALVACLPLAANGVELHDPGCVVDTYTQFSLPQVADSDEGLSDAHASVTATDFPGQASATAIYNGAVRVRADSAPDGVGAEPGDSLVARATMATHNRVTSDTIPDGTLIDAEVDISLTGRIVNVGNNDFGTGSVSFNLGVRSESGSQTGGVFEGLLVFEQDDITQNTGFTPQFPDVDIITGNPFVDFVYVESFPVQMEVGEQVSVQIILMALSGVTHDVNFSDTASFEIVPLTSGVTIEVVAVPEPTPALLLAMGALVLLGAHHARARSAANSSGMRAIASSLPTSRPLATVHHGSR